MTTGPLLLTIPQAAQRAGVSEWTIRRAIKAGELVPWRRGRRCVRIPVRDLTRWTTEPEGGAS
ncbi:MAG: helix-turn-helix domain-containing protein [Actinomycetota bacterium]|jgi:excisionase family DNA binding protein|nr:helix-turn-helix domain-containing protein [Actinomycetota bacterium]